MRAAVQRQYGGPGVLETTGLADPRPDRAHAVIEVRAAALNWHDVLVRRGQYGSPLPHVPGADGAGVDSETGAEVVVLPSLRWGDEESAPGPDWEILGDRRHGTYAEKVRVPRDCVFPKPAALTWAQAAALPLVGLTTYRALFARGRLRAGESLLVLGAGGGVATMAVSLAAAAGAHVAVTSSSDAKIAGAAELGALGGVRYDRQGWVEAAVAMSPGRRGFDVVLDPVGSWADALAAVRTGGRLVVLGASRGESVTLAVRPFYFGQYDLLGTTMGSARDFEGLLRLRAEREVPPPVIDRVFPLERAAAAHEYLESGRGFGKIVLSAEAEGNA
ncbi:zinc-binding dehydrogenase [Amycolatopsis ultiminotia]|uniref:Zinc-binding dehydrogenase n=1 Tax=Amycolatopsis ultiminotia TaxID=543629 RepID=A0ABP6UVL1_9PSEU